MKESTVQASEFKTHCLRLIDEVADNGQPIVITKRGRPVAKLVPVDVEPKPLGGLWKGRGKTLEDIVYFDTSSEWDALK